MKKVSQQRKFEKKVWKSTHPTAFFCTKHFPNFVSIAVFNGRKKQDYFPNYVCCKKLFFVYVFPLNERDPWCRYVGLIDIRLIKSNDLTNVSMEVCSFVCLFVYLCLCVCVCRRGWGVKGRIQSTSYLQNKKNDSLKIIENWLLKRLDLVKLKSHIFVAQY